MNQAIENFIQSKRVAVVGASRTGKKFGNAIATELKQRGYEVFLVHPTAEEIGGEHCYANLAALQGKVDGVLICVPPQATEQMLREAVEIGVKNIWLQQGAQSAEALALARELGVTPVNGKCILMYAPPVKSIHGFHRAVVKVFGQL